MGQAKVLTHPLTEKMWKRRGRMWKQRMGFCLLSISLAKFLLFFFGWGNVPNSDMQTSLLQSYKFQPTRGCKNHPTDISSIIHQRASNYNGNQSESGLHTGPLEIWATSCSVSLWSLSTLVIMWPFIFLLSFLEPTCHSIVGTEHT